MAKEPSNIPSNIYPLRVQVVGANGEQVTDFGGSGGSLTNYALETGGNLAAVATSLAIVDDWDESDRAKVNSIVGQAGVQGGSGAVSASTQRVVLATDVSLPAGTNAIGKLSANSGIDIGDVDVTSLIPGTGATNLGKAVDSVAGSTDTGVAALFVRRDAPTTLTPADADYARAGLDSLGSQWVREYYAPKYEDNDNSKAVVEHRYTSAVISTATTTTIKTGAGLVHTINILGGTLGAVTVYDNTAASGTTICPTFTPTAAVPCPPIILDETFATGLTIVTAAATLINVSYR